MRRPAAGGQQRLVARRPEVKLERIMAANLDLSDRRGLVSTLVRRARSAQRQYRQEQVGEVVTAVDWAI